MAKSDFSYRCEMTETKLAERTATGLHDALIARIPPVIARSARVLDVGCGTGAWLRRLADAGYTDLTGADADVAQVAFGRCQLFKVDLNRVPWNGIDGTFDLVCAIEVIEHLDNVGIFLDEVARRMSPGGFFLLTTPNTESIAARLRFLLLGEMKQFDSVGDPTHVTPVVLQPFERVLERHGLGIVEKWGYPEHGWNVSSRWWVNALSRLLQPVLVERTPGDNLCMLIRRV